jgi:hypothetical protein
VLAGSVEPNSWRIKIWPVDYHISALYARTNTSPAPLTADGKRPENLELIELTYG